MEHKLNEDVEQEVKDYFGLQSKEDYSVKSITEGMSGAKVYLLKINNCVEDPSKIGIYILKIIDISGRSDGDRTREADRMTEIYGKAEKFQEHLVKKIHSKTVGDRLVIISEYTYHSHLLSESFYTLGLSKKCLFAESISCGLLEELNAGKMYNKRKGRIIDEWCKGRLNTQGRFIERITSLLVEPEADGIKINGWNFPNPAKQINRIRDKVGEMAFLWGNMHGDLHQKNILVNREENDDTYTYSIIDYDNYKESYLFFDHAYFELDLYRCTNCFQEQDILKWREAVVALAQFSPGKINTMCTDFPEVEQIRNSIARGLKWFKESNDTDSMIIQFTIARICAGINFFTKRSITNEEDQIKFLIYIAVYMDKLMPYLDMQWDQDDCSPIKRLEDIKFDNKVKDIFERKGREALSPEDILYLAYYYGHGPSKNEEEMENYLSRAMYMADQTDMEDGRRWKIKQMAANCFGDIHFEKAREYDKGSTAYLEEMQASARWYAQSAQGNAYKGGSTEEEWKRERLKGDHWGIYNLGCAWYYGYGVEKDRKEAERCFREAKEKGNQYATRMLKCLSDLQSSG